MLEYLVFCFLPFCLLSYLLGKKRKKQEAIENSVLKAKILQDRKEHSIKYLFECHDLLTLKEVSKPLYYLCSNKKDIIEDIKKNSTILKLEDREFLPVPLEEIHMYRSWELYIDKSNFQKWLQAYIPTHL